MIAYTFTNRNLEGFATDVKNVLVNFLYKEKILNDEQAVDLTNNYAFMYRKPSFFRRIFPKKVKASKEFADLILVKQCTLPEEKEECTENQKTSKESATPDSTSQTPTETDTPQSDAS